MQISSTAPTKPLPKLLKNLNRLWIRLTLTFILVVIIGVLTNTLVSLYLSVQEIRKIEGDDVWTREATFQFTRPGGVLDALETYYQQLGAWENIEEVLFVIESFHYPRPNIYMSFSFEDGAGNLLYDSHPEDMAAWASVYLDATWPLQVEGENVGSLRFMIVTQLTELSNTTSLSEYLIRWWRYWFETQAGWLLLIGVIVGVVFGIVFSRSLTAPLRRLVSAAEAFGSRELGHRVAVKGSMEVKQLALAFNNMAEKLERTEKLRRNLVADVAHELRTPLTVLQGNLRAMLDGVYPLTQAEVAGLYDQTRLLSRLVNDLHEVAQAEAQKLPMKKQVINLTEVITSALPVFEPVAESDGIALETSMPAQVLIFGDAGRLSQVFHNLLANALHYTSAGGHIEITLTCTPSQAVLALKDTGQGIAPEHLPHVFERFYRADRTRSRNTGGAGLGLAISKAITEAHGGLIEVESAGIPGQGTTFTVRLPLYKKQLQPTPPENQPSAPVTAGG